MGLENSILAGNTSAVGTGTNGTDCQGTINSLDYNLIQNTSYCTLTGTTTHNLTGVSADLGPLANNGGPTQSMSLLLGSPAIDAGNNGTCVTNDQRGYLRPVGGTCDMGASEFGYALSGSAGVAGASLSYDDNGPRTVTSDASGAYALLVPHGWSGVVTPSKTGLVFMPASRSYSGVVADQAGQNYGPITTVTLVSVASQDGWVLESSENSGQGGSINSTATSFILGDDASNRQYRAILSFSTGSKLPDTAVITKVTLKIDRQTVVGTGDPLTIFLGFKTDLKNGFFGTTSALEAGDFQAAAGKTVGPATPTLTGGWYAINLTPASAQINKLASASGLTQIRLRFKLEDNGDALANYARFFSGNVTTGSSRPQLEITYYVP